MHTTLFALKRAYQATRNELDARLAGYGVTAAQLDVLVYLHAGRDPEQRDLQAMLGISGATLTRLLDALEGKGLVRREVAPDDARVKRAILTEAGLALLDRLNAEEEAAFVARLLRGFSPAEVALLNDWLRRLAANMGDDSRNLF